MTEDELLALQIAGLHTKTPYVIRRVSMTQFSVARYYGGIKFNGEEYAYDPTTDTLTRCDVLRWMANQRKQKRSRADQMPMEGV